MIVGIGTDIVRISRVRRLAERFPRRIRGKIYTPDELSFCLSRTDAAPSLAGRFAAKDAVLKALGTGWGRGARFIDIEIISTADGAPVIHLRGKTAEIAENRGITGWHVSISHDGDMALAVAVAEGGDN
jgi:holo-[acyl-carrier protein] synthase